MDYNQWCEVNKTTHGHCPADCEHPQPLMKDNQLICGRCYHKYNEISIMIPCNIETCE